MNFGNVTCQHVAGEDFKVAILLKGDFYAAQMRLSSRRVFLSIDLP
jgi:hypothetical protein